MTCSAAPGANYFHALSWSIDSSVLPQHGTLSYHGIPFAQMSFTQKLFSIAHTCILADRNYFGRFDGLAPAVNHRNKAEHKPWFCESVPSERFVSHPLESQVGVLCISSSSASFVQIKQASRTSGVQSEWPPARWKASHARKSGGM